MKRDVLTALAVVALILFVCFAVGGPGHRFPAVNSQPFSMNRGPSAPGATKNVVMRINGEPVTEEEFGQFVAAAPEQYRQIAGEPAGRRVLADEIIKMKVLAQEGQRMGVDSDPQSAGQLALVRTNVAAAYALQKVVPKPAELEVRTAYAKQHEKFIAYPVSHIVLSCEASTIAPRTGTRISCAEATKKAEGLAARIRSGASFADLARKESDDSGSAAHGGLLGNVGHGQLPPQVEQVIFRLKPGEVSQPLRTQYGVHLFMTGAPTTQRYEDVRPQLEQVIRQQKLEQTLARMHDAAKVDYDPIFFGPPPGGKAAAPGPHPPQTR